MNYRIIIAMLASHHVLYSGTINLNLEPLINVVCNVNFCFTITEAMVYY